MFVALGEYLEELDSRLPDSLESVNIRIAQHTYPDMRLYRDHHGVVRICSSSVNGKCDNLFLTHRTENGSLEILPFVIEKGIQIFADPPIYVVGRHNADGFGEIPLPDWRQLLEDAGLGPVIAAKVNCYFSRHTPINYKDVPD